VRSITRKKKNVTSGRARKKRERRNKNFLLMRMEGPGGENMSERRVGDKKPEKFFGKKKKVRQNHASLPVNIDGGDKESS